MNYRITSEIEFWRIASMEWETCILTDRGQANVFGGWVFGLCATIDIAYANGYFNSEVYFQIDSRLKTNLSRLKTNLIPLNKMLSGYYWPLSLEGAKSRAEFCRKMFELCKKEGELK